MRVEDGRSGAAAAPGNVPDPLAAVAARRGGRRLLLLSDFDGTLCEFMPAPEQVWLSPSRRAVFEDLARNPVVTGGLVSGRRLADLRARAQLRAPIYYAGLHGLEIEGPGVRFLHERVTETRGLLQVLGRALMAHLSALPGVWLENKDLSIALHVRQAGPEQQAAARRVFERVVGPHLERSTLRVLPGSAVLEVLPNIDWTKGDAVRWILADQARRTGAEAWPVYLGDDVTDEDAFRAIGRDGLTIVVGERRSEAEFRLTGPAAVEAWLRDLAASLA